MPTFDLGSVVGPQGPQGATGPQGPQGSTGPQGPKGEDGTSAYEAAVSAGYTGSEQEFNSALATSYDPAGSAEKVQNALDAHIADKQNPHEVDPEQIGAIPATQKGAAGGVAELGADGKVPTEQMPGYAVTSGVCAMGQACPGGPLKLDDIQGNTVLGGTPAYNAPVSMESVEGPIRLHVTGKNLIDLTRAEDQTVAGVTCTLDPASGAMTLSGTCSRPGSYAFFMPNKNDPFWLPAGAYFLSGLQSDYESTSLRLYINCYKDPDLEQNVWNYGTTTTAGTAFTLSSGAWIVLALRVPDGMVTDGIVVYPQIEVGTEKTAFEPYQGEFADIPLLGTDGQTLEPLRMARGRNSSSAPKNYYDRIIRRDGEWVVERNVTEIDLTDATWEKSTFYMTPYKSGDIIRTGVHSNYPYCTHFAAREAAGQSGGAWIGNGLAIGLDVCPNGADTTISEMATLCADQAEAGTPVLVCTPMSPPAYEELHQDVQVLLNTLVVPGGVCSVWFEGEVLPSGADIGFPRGDYPSAGLAGAYRWLEELSNPIPAPTGSDLYAWALEQQRGGVFATSGSTTTQNVPEAGDLTGILSVTEQGSAVSMLVFGPTGKLYSAKRAAGVWRGWVQVYSDLTPPPLMGGAAASQAGTAGLVPAPAAGAQGKYLRGDGTWQTPQDTTYDDATQSAAGLLSSADKIKLDGIEAGANHYTHPSYTARSSGLYKIAVDETGHISGAEAIHTGRAARFVIGTSAAGWTAVDCDYLCDGTADDVEIKAAISALPSGGGEILLLDGTYNISSSINISKANVTIRGSGASTVLTRKFNGTSSNGVIGCSAASCRICDLTIDGNKSAYTSGNNRGVYASMSAANIKIDHITVKNAYTGIVLSGMTGGSISDCIVRTTSAHGIYISGASSVVLDGNTISGNGGNGITVESTEGIQIRDNNISVIVDIGIYVDSASKRGVISGNVIAEPNDDYSIYLSGTGVVITDNVTGRILLGSGSKSNIAAHNISSQSVSNSGTDNVVDGNTVYTEEVTA